MIRKGYRFKLAPAVVMLNLDETQKKDLQAKGVLPADREISFGYVIPGRVVPKRKTPPANAIKTSYTWNDGDPKPVFAVPVKVTGWSRTNMPYVRLDSKDKVLWFEDGRAYSASL